MRSAVQLTCTPARSVAAVGGACVTFNGHGTAISLQTADRPRAYMYDRPISCWLSQSLHTCAAVYVCVCVGVGGGGGGGG
eukprot:COSAG03_NODE_3031_length_2277_cov_1.709826_3_plen_79_part_01